MGLIYAAIHKPTGKVYVGKTIFELVQRKNQHIHKAGLGDKAPFHKALASTDKYEWKWVVLEQNIPNNMLFAKEQCYISLMLEQRYTLFNRKLFTRDTNALSSMCVLTDLYANA